MLLRVSGDQTDDRYNLNGILDEQEVGVPDEELLSQIAEAVFLGEAHRLAEVRDKLAPAAEQGVARFMTTDLVSVSQDTPLMKVVRNMVDAHVHRVLVLDDDGNLEGIISTTDVLAALMRVGSAVVG